MRQLETRPGRKFAAVFSPDGQHVAYLGRDKPGRWYQNARLYVAAVAGGGARDISGDSDRHLSGSTNGDVFNESSPALPVWSADGQRLYVGASWQGNEPLVALDAFAPNPTPQQVIAETGVLGGYTFDRARQRVAYLWSTLDDPAQLLVRDVVADGVVADGVADDGAAGPPRTLTALNQWLAEVKTGTIEEVWFKAADGYDLHGWILKPPGFDLAQQYPSILQIHGGPQTQYGNMYMHEFHYLAAAGYVVYWSNPRGSQGYGEGCTGAIYGQWGTVDYDDVMAWADYAAKLPYIDPERMGVTGGSYGGYMTTLIIGRTDRFKAAVAQRVVSNFLSFYGSSDLNAGLEHLAGTPAPWDDVQTNWAQSPISAIGNAKTPTLVIHSENDHRCDQEQGEQVFIALRRLGVDTELLLLPGESHGVSRGGRTDRRVARLEHMLGWFEKYLK
jgi:dipeptidyl aminopeptidase/acylaminoacyl peptidase